MQVDVRQQRRDDRALRRPLRAFRPRPLLHDPGLQPFGHQPEHTAIADPVLQEPHHPVVADAVEEGPDVGVQDPVHLPQIDPVTAHERRLSGGDGVSRRFSNHRKYESLKASSAAGTAAVFDSYVQWVRPPRTHQDLIRDAHKLVGQNPKEVFNHLYVQMNAVRRFGRLAKFDYLTMLGKLGIAPIDPGSAYLGEATGPLRGARLLFTGNVHSALSGKILDQSLLTLDDHLQVGMQTLEDAICNWQKSPGKFISFRG